MVGRISTGFVTIWFVFSRTPKKIFEIHSHSYAGNCGFSISFVLLSLCTSLLWPLGTVTFPSRRGCCRRWCWFLRFCLATWARKSTCQPIARVSKYATTAAAVWNQCWPLCCSTLTVTRLTPRKFVVMCRWPIKWACWSALMDAWRWLQPTFSRINETNKRKRVNFFKKTKNNYIFSCCFLNFGSTNSVLVNACLKRISYEKFD